jgi:aryl-alcohol dehydrogenase-like predicted oxidoreductase
MHMDQFISVSTEYSLLNSAPEHDVMEVCRTRHCSLLPYSPLKGYSYKIKILRNKLIFNFIQ